MGKNVVILVPVYKSTLHHLEQFSVDHLLEKAPGREVRFIAPQSLERKYYRERYRGIKFEFFDDDYFLSVEGYNRLLLSVDFYRRFSDYDYLLIHQPDAILIKDDLDCWMSCDFDYLGAPWPTGITLDAYIDNADSLAGGNITAYVGNGGFSLRSVRKTISIIERCRELHAVWLSKQLNEDCFFAFAGVMTDEYRIPNQLVASTFSLEIGHDYYYSLNNQKFPTGGHAWWKFGLAYWQNVITTIG